LGHYHQNMKNNLDWYACRSVSKAGCPKFKNYDRGDGLSGQLFFFFLSYLEPLVMRKTKLLSRSLISLVCFAHFVFNFSKVEAQTERIFFDKFGIEEGLPEECVWNIVQDQLGFIWVATSNGLSKFDDHSFT
jgi:hypothetical protein